MFKRVLLDDWHQIIPYVCFAMISLSFLFTVIKAMLLTRKESEHLAHLPLKNDSELTHSPNEETK